MDQAAVPSTDQLRHDRRATALLDRALVLANVVVWRVDLLQKRAFFNPAGFKALGQPETPDGISLQILRGLTHPEDLPLIAQANEKATASNEVVDIVVRYRFANGEWRHQMTRRVVERDATGQPVGFSGVAMDVTDLHLERQLVQQLHEHTGLAATALGVGFWSHQPDLFGNHVWQCDEKLRRIYACTPDQAPQDLAAWQQRFVHPDDRAWLRQRWLQADDQCEPLTEVRYRIIDGDGRERWVNSWSHRSMQGGRLAIFGMELDVTESQQALHERQRERQRQQFAIEASAVGIWERDLQGHVLYWNEAMYRQRGCTSADPRHPDQIMQDTTHPDDRQVLDDLFHQHIANGEPQRRELRLLLPDGSQRWILAHGRPMRNLERSVVGMAGINLDITAQKETALLQQEKQWAEQASRDKSAFMARMSHELRTPMNAVLGFAQLMRDEAAEPLSTQQLQRLSLIESAGYKLLSLIDNLLQTAQQIDGDNTTAARQTPGSTVPMPESATHGALGATAAGGAPPAAPAMAGALNVLCVEDNPVNLLLVREVLAMRPNVRLRCAEDGLSGIAAALQAAPDLMLLDLQLPDISGLEVLRSLRGQPTLAGCRFVALSADAMPESIEAARAAGFDDYWTKPIQFNRFLKHIDDMARQLGSTRLAGAVSGTTPSTPHGTPHGTPHDKPRGSADRSLPG